MSVNDPKRTWSAASNLVARACKITCRKPRKAAMRRREVIKVIAGSAAWPLVANAQPSNKPAIGFLSARSAKESAHLVDAFRKGLAEYGIVEGQNVTIDYSWADSHYERLPRQASDLLATAHSAGIG